MTDEIKCPHCAEYKAGWQRAAADYQNLQKEMAGQRGEWAEWSEMEIIREFIPIYDNFKKAFATDFENTDNTDRLKKWQNWKQGIEFIKKQFGEVLKSHGVEEIKTVGEQFDPERHEIVGEEEAGAEVEAGMIMKELEGGYWKKGKILKVAKVVVAAPSTDKN